MSANLKRWFILTPMLIALAACDEKLSTLAGPTPNLEPTFASIQSTIFEAPDGAGRPACTNCHTSNGRNPAGGLNLNHDVAYDQLVNVPARGKGGAVRVIPGDPDNSYVVLTIEGAAVIAGNRMPTRGPYLTDGQTTIIKRWIAIGAPRN